MLNDLVALFTFRVKVVGVRHVDAAFTDVLLDEVRIFLRVFAVERVPLRNQIIKAAAERPNIVLRRQIILGAGLQALRRSVVQMTRILGALQQFLEVVGHANHIPLDDALAQMYARRVQVSENHPSIMYGLQTRRQHAKNR